VKNALVAQNRRTVVQKLREAALAYHLERQWSKQKILTQYLNTVYFGNGAYGVESAVRTYTGRPGSVEEPAAEDVSPDEAALLAAIIASPSAYDPVQNPLAAKRRRDLVLRRMLDQRMIARVEYDAAILQAIPSEDDIDPPRPDSEVPYFSTWVTQQLVDRYRAGRVFQGGLAIRTTLDGELQSRARRAILNRLGGPGGPTAALVAIENRTGKVRAMVGGSNFVERPFNLATNGHRQPGSAFKPFILIQALQNGVSPAQTFTSKKKVFGEKGDFFVVNNYEDQYSGVTTLAHATARSDNSVYAELGLQLGTRKVARLARRMGIRTPVSTNRAMTLGGLEEGVTPLEMAFAYSTLANGGMRSSGTLAASERGPVALERVERRRGGEREVLDRNRRRTNRVVPAAVAHTAQGMLAGVLATGTGTRARLEEWAAGKTGTTENYGDAWFVGFTRELTVAVWVGYPDELKSMKVEYHGEPVTGGTIPAEIWRDFMVAALALQEEREPDEPETDDPGTPPPPAPAPVQPVPAPAPPPQDPPAEPQPAPESGSTPAAEPDAEPPPEEPTPEPSPAEPSTSPPASSQAELAPTETP
jgi:penicillin-binding protein 1A